MSDVTNLAMGGPANPPHLPWLVYTYGTNGFAQGCPVGCNLNVMGYPFPQDTRAVSSLYPFPLHFLICIS